VAYTLEQLAKKVGGKVVGDGACQIDSVATLQNAEAKQISFLTNSQYADQLPGTRASAVILTEDLIEKCPVNALVVNNAHAAYAKIAAILNPSSSPEVGHHHSALIAESSQVHERSFIGPHAVIGENCVIEEGVSIGAGSIIGDDCYIGKHTELLSNVTIVGKTRIGQRGLIHPGVVIGADGFGQAFDDGVWLKVPQLGGVRIGDDVEIGANTTIDCGAIEDTVIEEGVKLDNQIQVAHNVHIGAHTVIAAATAIAGSVTIGKHCMIGGAVAIAGHLTIADNVVITGMSMVTNSIDTPGSSYSSGMKAMPTRIWHRVHARLMKLDDLAKRLKNLEKKQHDN
jgi:UDP-3-O-[3-hydroxymyristoyl] glucosamine N-acyltransferase